MAIVGLGLMGGSLALALRGKCASILGIDSDPMVVRQAIDDRIVDRAAVDPADLLPAADLIVLATPVRSIITLLNEIPHLHPSGAVVVDLGSTKRAVKEAMQALPERFDPIGGHPICGKEQSSLTFADEGLYQGAAFILSLTERTSDHARQIAIQMAVAAGARPMCLDAETHDSLMAATSHFPYLLANALAAVTPLSAAVLTGPGFQSMTRLARSSPEMMRDILITNRENILFALENFRIQLSLIETLLVEGDIETLMTVLQEGADQKNNIEASKGAFL